jgi:hypothetical protein
MAHEPTTVDESVMAGHGYDSANSRPQRAAASVEPFYERVHAALAAHREVAAVWPVFSLHLVRRPRVGAAG